MPSYDALKKHQNDLIRKALDGSAFLGPQSALAVTDLTTYTAGPPVVISLATLPTGYEDLGYLTNDGMQFARETSNSEVTSFGSVTPTRTDVVSDTTTVTVMCQETKLLTVGLATGADLSALTPATNSGEVSVAKPARPKSRSYRLLTLAVDSTNEGDIYIARFLPRAKVTGFAEQNFGGGDDAIGWGVTFTGEVDSTLGYSERWIFGGAGWKSRLTAMGFTA